MTVCKHLPYSTWLYIQVISTSHWCQQHNNGLVYARALTHTHSLSLSLSLTYSTFQKPCKKNKQEKKKKEVCNYVGHFQCFNLKKKGGWGEIWHSIECSKAVLTGKHLFGMILWMSGTWTCHTLCMQFLHLENTWTEICFQSVKTMHAVQQKSTDQIICQHLLHCTGLQIQTSGLPCDRWSAEQFLAACNQAYQGGK